MGPIPDAQNPHKTIAAYAKDLEIVVFNGHVHTTEAYEVDGVKYFVLGGGAAEQDPILPGRTHIKVPEGYPLDQYWKGEAPKEDYNYLGSSSPLRVDPISDAGPKLLQKSRPRDSFQSAPTSEQPARIRYLAKLI
ncbi:MAG: hypothetical protein WAK20_17965 [Candidatus Acidiferrum sp.]